MVKINLGPTIVTDANLGCEPDMLSETGVFASVLQWATNASFGR